MAANGGGVKLGSILRDVLEAVALAAVLFLVLQFVIQNTVVDGPSMEPNFHDRQWVLVNKLAYRWSEPQRGDVIVFEAPDASGKEFIKRVIALPGETVSLREGQVRIDGVPLNEPWLPLADHSAFGPYTVPDGAVFVLGDNRPQSNDSRSWLGGSSALDSERIIGKAFVSIWPTEAWGIIKTDSPGPARQSLLP